jgi:CRP-like cAMP-binding protein
LNRLGDGDHFGELAAIDWGAGYAYPRLATVSAQTEVDLLVVPASIVNQAAREVPELQEVLQATVRDRLPTVREIPGRPANP